MVRGEAYNISEDLNEFSLVSRLDSGEDHSSLDVKGLDLLRFAHSLEFSSSEASSSIRSLEDSALRSDSLGSDLRVSGNHDDSDSSGLTGLDGRGNFFSKRILDSNESEESTIGLKLGVFSKV